MYDITRFVMCNLYLCGITGIFLGIRRIFNKGLSAKCRYSFWYLYFILLVLPFIPTQLAGLPSQIRVWFMNEKQAASHIVTQTPFHNPSYSDAEQNWMNDFFVSAEHSLPDVVSTVIFIIWLLGMGCAVFLTLSVLIRTLKTRQCALPVTKVSNPRLWQIHKECINKLNIRRTLPLYTACGIDSPLSCGLICPAILLPQDMDLYMDDDDIRYILLHEIQHYKNRDMIINICICLFRIIYWFNPLILFIFRKIQTDREIACDSAVIRQIGTQHRFDYGCTILKYAGRIHRGVSFSAASGLGGRNAQLKQRLSQIAEYSSQSRPKKLWSISVLILLGCLIFVSIPFLTVRADTSVSAEISPERIQTLDLDKYFSGYKGTFVLYDMNSNIYSIYNEQQSRQRISPVSTYKICSALFALDAGVIQPEDTSAVWDGTEYPFDSWENDQDLTSAMTNSVNWYFQDLDQKTGTAKLAADYRKVSYGNADISGGISGYWLDSSLRISPLEQTVFLKNFYNNVWDFEKEDIETVKESMLLSDTDSCRLYGKTGTNGSDGKKTSGWFIGFIEQPQNTWCFALNIQSDDNAGGSNAAGIALEILEDMGIYIPH